MKVAELHKVAEMHKTLTALEKFREDTKHYQLSAEISIRIGGYNRSMSNSDGDARSIPIPLGEANKLITDQIAVLRHAISGMGVEL
jgi:predicted glycosyltransferase